MVSKIYCMLSERTIRYCTRYIACCLKGQLDIVPGSLATGKIIVAIDLKEI